MLFLDMKKPRNIFIYRRNAYYHIFNRGNRKENIFLIEKDYQIFCNLLYKYTRKNKLLLISYCFMPNHYHLIIKSGNDCGAITKFMRAFMVAYAMYFNRKHNKVGHLFQGPFQIRRILGLHDLNGVITYLKNNPLEADLVGGKELESYRWYFIKDEKSVNKD